MTKSSSVSRQPSALGKAWRGWMSLPLWLQILVGMILGIAAGLSFGKDATMLKPIGTL
ncbi:MAG: dicarboxylate/amino acid:cation symporter, partial [Shewanella sp.]|nr:dicarboxylate/amino acid:cation symporter [Shewanella sp.]